MRIRALDPAADSLMENTPCGQNEG
jgi:hypothetical protein